VTDLPTLQANGDVRQDPGILPEQLIALHVILDSQIQTIDLTDGLVIAHKIERDDVNIGSNGPDLVLPYQAHVPIHDPTLADGLYSLQVGSDGYPAQIIATAGDETTGGSVCFGLPDRLHPSQVMSPAMGAVQGALRASQADDRCIHRVIELDFHRKVDQPDLPGPLQSPVLKACLEFSRIVEGLVHHEESIADNPSLDKLNNSPQGISINAIALRFAQHALAFSSILSYNSTEITFGVWRW
jgi:hypothetical protein